MLLTHEANISFVPGTLVCLLDKGIYLVLEFPGFMEIQQNIMVI